MLCWGSAVVNINFQLSDVWISFETRMTDIEYATCTSYDPMCVFDMLPILVAAVFSGLVFCVCLCVRLIVCWSGCVFAPLPVCAPAVPMQETSTDGSPEQVCLSGTPLLAPDSRTRFARYLWHGSHLAGCPLLS